MGKLDDKVANRDIGSAVAPQLDYANSLGN
ncbi:Mycobacterium numidiamassiliense ORFan [Mycobacterium numidiamassiliense]|jgi:hypothetical protein|uniref:Mycobacterium numidiamassiliense ORFan n=1 Tax=Mycobacterium numidiamassiliense TaxID=1841861 RepID=A0A2U3P6T9_9MYCO|nr:Mycobacterium numidiamassiliense ORFan [Mycobacterium numidiamassiliense]